jgi:hypothetical protein
MRSSRTPNQEKALKWYVEKHHLTPQLSAHPVYYFVDKGTGKEKKVNISHIVADWERMRKVNKAKAEA